jgi:hypothetical protein
MKLGVALPFIVASRPDRRDRNTSPDLHHDPLVAFGLLANRSNPRDT